ncbi:outer membrane lipoprotein-sorting protein [bacterium]|nr:outer membrane lipoprotein-sorting protein [bacterium]
MKPLLLALLIAPLALATPKKNAAKATRHPASATKPAGAKPSAKTLSPAEILRKADDARAPEGSFSFQVKITDYDGASALRTNVYKVFSKDDKYALIETLAPTRLQGRKILLRGEDLWLYLPSVKRPTRISLQQRLTGEVANGDIARTRFFDDYAAKITGQETIGGKPHYVLDLHAKSESVTYRRVQLWVDTASYQPAKAQFYALSGKLLKTSNYSDFAPALGLPRASKVVIKDALAPNKQSHLSYSQYAREDLDDSFFTKEALP